MRILLAHNAYKQRGGEDVVVEAERNLLASRGNTVDLFQRHNDATSDTSRAALALQTLWSQSAATAFQNVLRSMRPDVVHIHNTFALISPSVYWVAAAAGVPVVQTLHNFRLLCPQAMLLRNGRVCEDCLGHVPWRGAIRGCYRGSRTESAVLASMLTFHRALGTWQTKVARYIALTEFSRNKFIEGGLPARRIVVKPNFADLPAPHTGTVREGFLFVGRLSPEKGLTLLVEAVARQPEAQVRIVGTGQEARLLAAAGPAVTQLGELEAEAVYAEMASAMALILPSICYEQFPRTLVEAYANGLPVIASRLGPLPQLVQDGVTGLLVEPGDADDLARKMQWAQRHPDAMATMGRRARARYETEFTADHNYSHLMAIYAQAIEETDAKRNRRP